MTRCRPSRARRRPGRGRRRTRPRRATDGRAGCSPRCAARVARPGRRGGAARACSASRRSPRSRSNGRDDTYVGARQADLIQSINGLSLASQRAESEITDLEHDPRLARQQHRGAPYGAGAGPQQAETLGILAGTLPATGPGIRITVTDPHRRARPQPAARRAAGAARRRRRGDRDQRPGAGDRPDLLRGRPRRRASSSTARAQRALRDRRDRRPANPRRPRWTSPAASSRRGPRRGRQGLGPAARPGQIATTVKARSRSTPSPARPDSLLAVRPHLRRRPTSEERRVPRRPEVHQRARVGPRAPARPRARSGSASPTSPRTRSATSSTSPLPEVGDDRDRRRRRRRARVHQVRQRRLRAARRQVVARNEALDGTPELVNSDPYGAGWLFEIVPPTPPPWTR